MKREEITAIFDRQAQSYDQQWQKMSGINNALHLLTDAVFSGLPPEANILCVGAGTGTEILHLAQRFSSWRFTAVEPSAPMLEVFRRKADERGVLSRCVLHNGYLESLPPGEEYDAATSFLVSQFILNRDARTAYFQGIAKRLRPNGLLMSSDLAGDLTKVDCQNLLEVWFKVMNEGGISEEGITRMREAYARDVAVLPPTEVRHMIVQGGFESPVLFFQAGMIHAWYAKRSSTVAR